MVILLGATPFAADLLRAFSRRGLDIGFDALWLESYHDERISSGRIVVRADVSRPVEGRGILLIDDVFDIGPHDRVRTHAHAAPRAPARS